jgi:hypothetical protein
MLEKSGRPTPRSSRFTPGEKTQYPSYKRLGGHRGRPGKARKISAPPDFEPRTVQPIAIRCNGYCIPARYWEVNFTSGMLLCDYWRADGYCPTLLVSRLPAVWCSRELLLGSVTVFAIIRIASHLPSFSSRAYQTPSCQTYVHKTTGSTGTSLCHADTGDVITAWRYVPTLTFKNRESYI